MCGFTVTRERKALERKKAYQESSFRFKLPIFLLAVVLTGGLFDWTEAAKSLLIILCVSLAVAALLSYLYVKLILDRQIIACDRELDRTGFWLPEDRYLD